MNSITIPLFPLNGVIFFPNSQLPLNIFEKKYLEMVDFSLSNNRLIGMVQNKNDSELYKIGCVGKINSFYETNEGKYIINLGGQKIFSIINELPKSNKFTLANVELLNEKKIINKEKILKFNKEQLIYKYKNFIKKFDIKIDLSLVEKIDEESLVKFIAMSCPFSTSEKQMLIETYSINELGCKIMDLFDFYSNINLSETIN